MEIKLVWEMVIRLTGSWSVGFLTPSQKEKKGSANKTCDSQNSDPNQFSD